MKLARLQSIGRLFVAAFAVMWVMLGALPASAHAPVQKPLVLSSQASSASDTDTILIAPADRGDEDMGRALLDAPPPPYLVRPEGVGTLIAAIITDWPPVAPGGAPRYGRAPPQTFIS